MKSFIMALGCVASLWGAKSSDWEGIFYFEDGAKVVRTNTLIDLYDSFGIASGFACRNGIACNDPIAWISSSGWRPVGDFDLDRSSSIEDFVLEVCRIGKVVYTEPPSLMDYVDRAETS